jgi:hypothetical protein
MRATTYFLTPEIAELDRPKKENNGQAPKQKRVLLAVLAMPSKMYIALSDDHSATLAPCNKSKAGFH